MTTKIRIEVESIPQDVVVDVELWVADRVGRTQYRDNGVVSSQGKRKDDFKFSRLLRTFQCDGDGLNEYVYPGQAIMLRERHKP